MGHFQEDYLSKFSLFSMALTIPSIQVLPCHQIQLLKLSITLFSNIVNTPFYICPSQGVLHKPLFVYNVNSETLRPCDPASTVKLSDSSHPQILTQTNGLGCALAHHDAVTPSLTPSLISLPYVRCPQSMSWNFQRAKSRSSRHDVRNGV